MSKWFRRVKDFFTAGIWQKEKDEYKSKHNWWLARQARLIIYTVQGINQHASFVRCAALTFYSIMAIVPVLALAFGIIKGFGLDNQLSEFLLERLPKYNEIAASLLDVASGVLMRTKGGIVALTGLVLLIWAAVRVFVNIENAFNIVWEIKKSRSIGRKAGAYIAVIFLIPLLIVVVSGITSYLRDFILQNKYLPNTILFTAATLVGVWLIFTAMYIVIPNTKVKFRNAALAAFVASVAFLVFQGIYMYIQNGVTAYNIIYGSFAALPLFLIWVQTSWIIILLGAELSFSYQNIDRYAQEKDSLLVSYDNRRKITLAAMIFVIEHFTSEQGGVTSEMVAKRLKLPIRIVRDVLFDLETAGLIAAIKSGMSDKINVYIPARNVSTITFYGVLEAVESTGMQIDKTSDSPELITASKILDTIKDCVSGSENDMPLIELIENESSNNW